MIRLSPFAIVLVLACGFAGAVRGQAASSPTLPTLTIAAYDNLLGAAQARLQSEIAAGTSSGSPATTLLEPDTICVIEHPDGTLTIAHNEWIVASIADAESETDPDRRPDKIDAVLSELRDMRGLLVRKSITVPSQSRAVSTARKLLSSDVYASDPVQPPSGIDRAFAKFWSWLQKKMTIKSAPPRFSWFSIPEAVWVILWKGFLIVTCIGVVGLIGWLIVRLIMSSSGRSQPASLLAMTDEEAQMVAARSFDKLLNLANQRAESGDFRTAFRLVYLATLVSLDSAGLVRLNQSRTNWEYLKDLRNGPHIELANLLKPLTVDFDRIWYGFARAGRADYEGSVHHYERIAAAMRPIAASGPANPFASKSLGAG